MTVAYRHQSAEITLRQALSWKRLQTCRSSGILSNTVTLCPDLLMAMAVARPLRPQPTARARQERQLELLSRIFSMLIGYARFHLKLIVIARFYFLQEFQGSRLCFLCPYANNTMRAIAGPLCNEVCLDLEGHYCSYSLPYRKAAGANS